MLTTLMRNVGLMMLFGLGLHVHAQEALLRKADRLFERYSFAEAISTYERAFAAGASDVGAARRLAESYRRVRQVGRSEMWYSLVVSSPEATPQDLYRYADALRVNGRYAAADSVMQAYARMNADDSRVERQGRSAERYGLFIIDPMLEGDLVPVDFNTEAMDVSPAFWGDRLVFASARPAEVGITRKHAWNDQPFLNLYIQENGRPRLLKGSVNTRYHESNVSFSADGTEMYFTRNGFLNGRTEEGADGFNNLHIYTSRFVNGAWTAETAFKWNDPSFSTGHPSISGDGRTLYFASDRPGGHGGVDIWMCRRDDAGEWDVPVNLGPEVNTEGDELFPFIHADHALFFSSDGHAGLGGLDVLMSWTYNGSCQPAVNLGAPVNGRSDDIGFVLDHAGGNAWWSSDRAGGSGGEDVYHLRLQEPFRIKVRIHGRVLSAENGEALERIPVRALKLDRTILAQATTNAAGEYEFVVTPQPVVVWGGIPGASDTELPMDEHVILDAGGDLSMDDIRLSTVLDLPLAVRVLETTTGLPARGVQVSIADDRGARWDLKGATDAQGLARFTLSGAKLGEALNLRLTLTYEEVERSEELALKVVDGTLRRIERRMDLGRHAVAAVVPSTIGRYHALEQLEEGSQWAGRVVDAGSGDPLEHVQVSLLDVGGAEIVRTETDSTGHYHLRTGSVPFSVLASIPGGDSARVDGISPFGDMNIPDMAVDGVMDLPVNALLSDAVTAEPLEGVEVMVVDKRDGTLLLNGRTDARGVLQGTIKDRRFGSEQNIEVRFSKEGYITQQVDVDFSVLAFLEQALGGLEGFRMMPSMAGLDLAQAMHLRPILFDYNDARIRSDAAQELELVARVMQVDTTIVLELRSHTDCRGGAAFNRFLSVRRAQSAFDHLVELGIAPVRLRAKGMGELQPVNRCTDGVECTEAEHQENRRTEFIVVKAGPAAGAEGHVAQRARP